MFGLIHKATPSIERVDKSRVGFILFVDLKT